MTDTDPLLSLRGAVRADWRAIVAALHDADLDSPRRSTVPLLAYWQNPLARFSHLQNQLGVPEAGRISFSFEHAVDVAAGRGKPSFTDLMILAPSVAIAIEAKYTEPVYESVKLWLREPRDQNRCEVLGGWLDMIHLATRTKLTVDLVLQLPYQLVHRAASACFPGAAHRAVLYQIFDVTQRARYLTDLRNLRALLPAHGLKLGILATPAMPSELYSALLERWDAGERKMAHAVRAALLDGEILRFEIPSLSLL